MNSIISTLFLCGILGLLSSCLNINSTEPEVSSPAIPQASAMPDTSVLTGDSFKIYGAGLDEDGEIKEYAYRYLDEEAFITIDEAGVTVKAPDSPQVLTIIFRVTDVSDNHAFDTARVTVVAKQNSNDLTKAGYKGSIKTLKIASGIEKKIMKFEHHFDIRGNLIQSTSYFEDGSLRGKLTYKYSPAGNMEEESEYNAGGILIRRIINQYNSNDQLIHSESVSDSLYSDIVYDEKGYIISEIVKYNNGGLYGSSKYINDEHGNVLEMTQFDENNKVVGKIINTFDERQNLVRSVKKNSGGTVLEKREWTYNSDGRVLKYLYYESDSVALTRKTYTYDDRGNILTFLSEGPLDSIKLKEVYTYDGKDQLTRQQRFSPTGELLIEQSFKYNENGFNTWFHEINQVNKTEYIETYAYNFDDQGNWTRHITYKGELQSPENVLAVDYQSITYY